jgi:hypothetical protein
MSDIKTINISGGAAKDITGGAKNRKVGQMNLLEVCLLL